MTPPTGSWSTADARGDVLELVERKIAGYDEVLARGLNVEPPDHRPAPRRVRIRVAS